MSKNIDDQEDFFTDGTPGVFSVDDAELITKKTFETITYIKTLNNPRLLIIETWLIVDWFIRQILATGLNISELSRENFDARYSILPNSFKECADILKRYISVQKKLKPLPPPPKVSVNYSLKTRHYLLEKHPELLKKLDEVIDELEGKQSEPPAPKWSIENILSSNTLEKKFPTYRSVSEYWLKSVSRLDATWFRHALKLNDKRNLAAHTFNTNELFLALGLSRDSKEGVNKDKIIKDFCLDMLDKLVGIKPTK